MNEMIINEMKKFNIYYRERKNTFDEDDILIKEVKVISNHLGESLDQLFPILVRVQRERFPDLKILDYQMILNTLYFSKEGYMLNQDEWLYDETAYSIDYVVEVEEAKYNQKTHSFVCPNCGK